jgi:hypothetical protein
MPTSLIENGRETAPEASVHEGMHAATIAFEQKKPGLDTPPPVRRGIDKTNVCSVY